MVVVEVRAPVRPTESPDLVRQAAVRFLTEAETKVGPGEVVARGGDLQALRQRVWELRIIDTFRGRFQAGIQGDGRTVCFTLSKQAALAGKVSFPPRPHVLGELEWTVRLEEDDPWADAEALAWWLAPETRDGEIVGQVAP